MPKRAWRRPQKESPLPSSHAYRDPQPPRRFRPGRARTAAMLAASFALATTSLAAAARGSAQPAAPPAPAAGHGVDYTRACPVATKRGMAACMVLVRTNVTQRSQRAMLRSEHAVGPAAAPTGVGDGPASLQSAYKLPSSTAGTGETVA